MSINHPESPSKLGQLEEAFTSNVFILREALRNRLKYLELFLNPLRIQDLPPHKRLIYTSHFFAEQMVLENLKGKPVVGPIAEKISDMLMKVVAEMEE